MSHFRDNSSHQVEKGGAAMATKDKRIVISGEQRADIDPAILALVIIRLARQWLQAQPAPPLEKPTPPNGKDTAAA
jgi:hypothetical protein